MKHKKMNFFSESALVILVAVVTLLLQLISFATTWSGSGIYLEGVFPYASLLFAVAIQATAYFFSNSLRDKVTVLKVVAMLAAMCCSTYYSYIGVYNSVNSPVVFLQERYAQIEKELTDIYKGQLAQEIGEIKDIVNEAAADVIGEYSLLSKEGEQIRACREALAAETDSRAENIRVPKQWEYETYEEYAAAYQVYVQSISAGNNVEEQAVRDGILSAYGYASVEEMNQAEAEQIASETALLSMLGMSSGETLIAQVSDMGVGLSVALDGVLEGADMSPAEYMELSQLLQGAKVCGATEVSVAEITAAVKSAAGAASGSLMDGYPQLVAALEGGRVTTANTMELKGLMDSEILNALLKLDMQQEREEQYAITDLYLVPIKALQDETTRMTALFCLGMAAMVDGLSILFAISLRERKALWKRRTLLFARQEDYVPQIQACLPAGVDYMQELEDFLKRFEPSPETEREGYMMRADMDTVTGYSTLAAFLCQVNLAKILPGEFLGREGRVLLLKARFVFWANSLIYETREEKRERILYE